MPTPTIAVIDFGSQYTQLIARRVREQQVHSLIFGPQVTADELRRRDAIGMIFSGGPSSVTLASGPTCRDELLEMGLPILGICYGMQLLCRKLGGEVTAGQVREYGRAQLQVIDPTGLVADVQSPCQVWMSHGDAVMRVSDQFVAIARTETLPIAAVRHVSRPIFGVQFHPEVSHTPQGAQMIRSFVADVCKAPLNWVMGNVVADQIERIRNRVGKNERVLCGLSGGVDSSVTAALLHRAIGDRLECIFVDNGLLRHGEADLVEKTFRRHFKMNLHVARASERFLGALRGVIDPQEKRRIIGHEFIEVFKTYATGIDNARYLAQGTLYPDVIESGHGHAGVSAGIKLHHNVGGLPAELGFELIEPLRDLFKDEVRRMGEHLDLPEEIVWRHPFPGPGLAIRVIGEVTPDRVQLLQRVDTIVLDEVRASGWYGKIGQGFAVLLPVSSVGVMGDDRSYASQHVAVVRFVESTDFMTADWVRIDHSVLERIASRIMNEVDGVNRVVYDISSKPPATIEWE